MKSFLTDENNDLKLDGVRNIAIGEDINAVVQLVQNALNTLLGEIQLNTSLGVPYFETILNKQNPNVSVWESYMVEEAEKVNGVVRVNNIQTRIENNVLSYTMEILTIYGQTTVSG